jgi:hypothetical protein
MEKTEFRNVGISTTDVGESSRRKHKTFPLLSFSVQIEEYLRFMSQHVEETLKLVKHKGNVCFLYNLMRNIKFEYGDKTF